MMKKQLTLLLLACAFVAKSQTNIDTSINVDLLRAPSSPAFNLLGISPSSIDRPTDLNAFRVSVQNASNNFSKFPSDYSVELAPASILKLPRLTLDRYDTASFANTFWQSLSFSVGITQGNLEDKVTGDSSTFTKLGFGFKFSIIRPRWTDATRKLYNELRQALNESTDTITAIIRREARKEDLIKRSHAIVDSFKNLIKLAQSTLANEPEAQKEAEDTLNAQQKRALQPILTEITRITTLATAADSTQFNKIKAAVKALRIDRIGFFLDFAGGIALDFPDNRFDYSRTSKAGAWLTGGYENSNDGWSALGIVRYLYQPDKIFADSGGKLNTAHISTLDAGVRGIYTAPGGKFSLSAEGIYRSVLNNNVIDPNWRFTLNADYDIGFNKKLTLAIGKNFDGTITKNGNLVAALNFIAGFGATKKMARKVAE